MSDTSKGFRFDRLAMELNNARRSKIPNQVLEDEDIEFEVTQALFPLLPSRTYTVVFERHEKRFMWKREVLLLWFTICDQGEWFGVRLFMSCNVPTKGKWTLGCKFVRNWMLAAGRRPDRFDRMSTREFRGKCFVAQVKAVTQTSKQKKLPDYAQYSVIDELISKA